MGRAKLNMKLIANWKSRMVCFHKRKRCLQKKAYEFSTLCGVDACIIMYGPDQDGRPTELSTWPENQEEVKKIINRYKATTPTNSRTLDLSSYFVDRKKKIDNEISKKRMKNFQARWDERIDGFSLGQMKTLLGILDTKIEEAQSRVHIIKGEKSLMKEEALGMMGMSYTGSTPNDISQTLGTFERNKELLENQQPTYNLSDQGYPLVNPNKIKSEEYCTQFDGIPTSQIQYSQWNAPIYYHPTVGMLDSNVMVNNPSLPPMYYYYPTMQIMPPPCEQYAMMPSTSSQPHAPDQPLAYNFFNINDSEIKNKTEGL